MKDKILNNLGFKILSVIGALFIWILVVNIDDYKITKQINGIKVQVENADAIQSQGKVYEVSDGETVDIIVKGRRTVVESLTADDFIATADLSKLSMTNAAQISVVASSKQVNNAISISCVDNMMTILLENQLTQQFPISVETEGEAGDGYTIGSKVAAPNLISVSGAESVIQNIASAVVKVSVNGETEDISCEAVPVFYDAEGKEIKSEKLILSSKKVNVNVQILKTKAVTLDLSTKGSVAAGYELTSVDYEPKTITVAGRENDLKQISKVTINDVDVSGLNEDTEQAIDLQGYLPDGITTTTGNEQVMVQIKIGRIMTNELPLSADDIQLLNTDDTYNYEIAFLDYEDSNKISLSGVASNLSKATVKKLKPVIDMQYFGTGTHTVTVSFSEIEGVSLNREMKVTVTITSKK